ncbi:MAG: SGNH/GDSL hydrolase family protein [Chitinophagaceae bacterium]
MFSKLTLLALFVGSMLLMSWRHDKKRRIIFFGDSITQMGVLPNGYISVFKQLMLAEQMPNPYEVIGAGIGGNKVYDLYLRLENDVLAKSPSLVVIYIGVNDVWHKKLLQTGTDAPKFEQFYKALIQKIRASGSKIIICTPAVIGEKKDNGNALDGELDTYSDLIRKIAQEETLTLVDIRTSFKNYIQENNVENKEAGVLTTDGVHLNDEGNKKVAALIWETVKAMK